MLPKNFTAEEQGDGTVIVRGVPIFAECSKAGFDFGDEWISLAVDYHRSLEDVGNVSPVVIQHFDNKEGLRVLPAGAWTNTRKGTIRTKDGRTVPAVLVDLVFTDHEAWARAKKNQLMWRSPEIPVKAATGELRPHFKCLSLLDRHKPHNDDLPAMSFSDGSVGSVRFQKQAPGALSWDTQDAGPVVAFASGPDSIVVLMEPEAMPEDIKLEDELKDDDAPKTDDAPKSDDGPPKEKSSGWKAALDALKAVDLTAEEIPEVVAAITEFATSLEAPAEGGEEPMPEPMDDTPIEDGPADPTEMPLADSEAVISLASDNAILKKRLDAMDAEKARDAAVDGVMPQVEPRGFTREEMISFADTHGADALAAHAAQIVAKIPVGYGATFQEVMDANDASQHVPDAVLKFQSEGPEAYEWAQRQAQAFDRAKAQNTTSVATLDRWLEVNKPGGDFVRGPQTEV